MGLTDVPAAAGPTAEDAALQIRRIAAKLQRASIESAKRINALITKHGRAEIDTVLGTADAAELDATYAKIQEDAPVDEKPVDLPKDKSK